MVQVQITKNGEITFDTETKEYTVWNEVYSDSVCITPDLEAAEAAFKEYCDTYLREGD